MSSVGIGGPYEPLLSSPVLGQRLFDLFDYLRWKTSVETRLNEFAILYRRIEGQQETATASLI